MALYTSNIWPLPFFSPGLKFISTIEMGEREKGGALTKELKTNVKDHFVIFEIVTLVVRYIVNNEQLQITRIHRIRLTFLVRTITPILQPPLV